MFAANNINNHIKELDMDDGSVWKRGLADYKMLLASAEFE